MTVDDVARHLECSPSKISRLETGQRGASASDIRALCELFQVDEGERDRLLSLAREGRHRTWWQTFDLPYATYVGLEAEATAISEYQPCLIPALLQTSAYTQVVHERGIPRLSNDQIAQRVEERRIRQQRLASADPPRFRAFLNEAVLLRVVGSAAIMLDQLDRLLSMATAPHVLIQVVAFDAGPHQAIDNNFTLLDFASPVPAVLYVEGLGGHLYLEHPEDVERARKVLAQIAELALGPQLTVDLIRRIRAEYAKAASLATGHSH